MDSDFRNWLWGFIYNQRIAICSLSVLLFLLILYKAYIPENDITQISEANDTLFRDYQKKPYKPRAYNYKPKKHLVTRDSLFIFDPNTLSDSGFIMLGFNRGQIASINKFRQKAHFYSAADFAKMYVISAKQFLRVEPFIRIADSVRPKSRRACNKPTFALLELNSADSVQLQTLPLVGEKRARIIANFRKKLGGFYSLSQLHEVYGLPDSVISLIANRLYIDTSKIQRININTATFKDFQQHPYIAYSGAKRLMNYRRIKGHIASIYELRNDRIFEPEELEKFLPYLTVE